MYLDQSCRSQQLSRRLKGRSYKGINDYENQMYVGSVVCGAGYGGQQGSGESQINAAKRKKLRQAFCLGRLGHHEAAVAGFDKIVRFMFDK